MKISEEMSVSDETSEAIEDIIIPLAEEVEDIVIDLASEETEELAADDHEDVLEDDMIVEAIEEEELEEKIEELKEVIEENNPDHEQESATH